MDEAVEALLTAWRGEPFEYHGATVKVTPTPRTKPHPPVMIGGSGRPGARRAARFGLPFAPPAHLPELEAYYYEQCEQHGTTGFVVSPPADIALVFVAEDPDRGVGRAGPPSPPRGDDVRRVADARHQVVGALARDDRRRAARRGHLPDPVARGLPGARTSGATTRSWCSTRCAAACPSIGRGSACASTPTRSRVSDASV